MMFPSVLLTLLPALAPVISRVAALPVPQHQRRQIGAEVLGFTTVSGDVASSFAAAVASETGEAAAVTAGSTSVAPTSSATSSAPSSTSGGSGSSKSSSGGSATDIITILEDLGQFLIPLVSKTKSSDLSTSDSSDLLSSIESHISGSTSDIKGLSSPTDGNGSVNVTAVADDAIFILQNTLSITSALESDPVTAVVLGPEAAVIDAGLTAMLVACQLFVNVEPVMAEIIKGNKPLKAELEDLGGAVLKVLGI